MAAWTEDQKAAIRAYLGFPALFRQFEPRLENNIKAVQAIADGGNLPTDATQLRMITALDRLATIDCRLTDTQKYAEAIDVDKGDVKVDFIRAGIYLRMEGRRLINQLAIPLGTRPVRDYYTGGLISDSAFGGNSPFPTDLA